MNPSFFSVLLFLAELVAAVQYFEQRQQREKETQHHQYKSKEVRERISFLRLQAQVKLTSLLNTSLKLYCNHF